MTDTIPEDDGKPYWLPDWLYQILKWVALVVLPSLVIFFNSAGPSMGLPHVEVIVTTLNALGLLIAACIGISQAKAAGSK